jgi:hypothetical protein
MQVEQQQPYDEKPRQEGHEEERAQVVRPQPEEAGCQERADGSTEMIHRPVKPEGPTPDRGVGRVGNQGISW